MKKLISIFLTIFMLSMLLNTVSAVQPVDGDIVDVWAQLDEDMGDSLTEVADGVKVTFGRPSWAIRVTTLDAYKLNGLTITFKNVAISDKNAMALGIGNTEGGWVDTKGIFFIHFTSTTNEVLGAAPNGYIMAKIGNDMSDVQPRIINDTLLTKKPAGTIKVSFTKKADGSWIYDFNGQQFPISKEQMDANISKQDKVYISFGNWGQARGTITYTVADIKNGSSGSTTSSSATVSKSSTAASSSKAGSTVVSSAVSSESGSSAASSEVIASSQDLSDTQSGESAVSSDAASSGSSSASETKGGSNTGTVVVVVIIIVALAGAGTAAFLLLKKKKA